MSDAIVHCTLIGAVDLLPKQSISVQATAIIREENVHRILPPLQVKCAICGHS